MTAKQPVIADTEKGGETTFPTTDLAHYLDPAMVPDQTELSECARGHVNVKPRKRLALLFYTLPVGTEKDPNMDKATVDTFAEHSGCPPTKGLKWTSTIWVHPKAWREESFSREYDEPRPDPGRCVDLDAECQNWAGALTSSLPCFVPFQAGDFPWRNRRLSELL
jgi:hypothetical protein